MPTNVFPNYQTIGEWRLQGRGETLLPGEKVLPISSNVAEEKVRWQEKLMAEIRHNFTKSERKVAEENFQQQCYL